MLAKRIQKGLCLLLLFNVQMGSAETKEPLPEKARAFTDYMVKQYHYKRETLIHALSQAKYDQEVIYRITHPYETKPWNVYRNFFVTEKRIRDGVNYWKTHDKALRYAKQHYGIPSNIIVAIIGVETNYGEQTGKYSALNALTTLAFHYPQRAKFFTKELAQFFLLTKEQQLPIFLMQSSYAGAIGIPQFMPSTYRHYAINYSKNGRVDLVNDHNDAIVSIANYLHTHGWRKGQPIVCAFTNKKAIDPNWISNKAQPKNTVNQLKNKGIIPSLPLSPHQKAAIVQLKNEAGNEYWLTFHNFRVIMRYNPRIIYAMAVYQLSQAIQKQHDKQAP